ncbi:MAG: hypothetical protein Q4D29_08715 [Lachnospiraceae bacterium]|nr:hypothetical protein [Lachnospiraceae bacterium]
MDFNSSNKNTGKRKAQSIQDMINSTPSGAGIKKSGYSGPKSGGASAGGRAALGNTASMGGVRPIGSTSPISVRPAGSTSSLGNTSDLSGISVNRSNDYDRWGNSNEGMPKPKKARYKADVGNPMRGNVLKRELEQSRSRLDKKSRDLDLERRRNRKDSDDFDDTGALPRVDGYVAPAYRGPLDSYGWIVYIGIMAFCIIVTLIASGVKPRGSGYTYPMNVITISGVVNTSYEHRMGVSGTFGVLNSSSTASSSSTGDATNLPDGNYKEVDAVDPNSLNDLGSEGEAATLDDGSMEIPGVTPATNHEELVKQIQSALEIGNYSFISAKFAYEDAQTGQLDPYPMSQVKHFCEYMTANPGKISSFISTISSEEYAATNGTAQVIKLPIMKFTVKMGASTDTFVLDNTVVSVSGFSDVIVNGNQDAAIYPLLPCMYTVTLTNNAWATPSQSQEIEATLGEGNLEIKVGQASE